MQSAFHVQMFDLDSSSFHFGTAIIDRSWLGCVEVHPTPKEAPCILLEGFFVRVAGLMDLI